MILYTFRHGFPGFAWTNWLALIPFAIMSADFIENGCIVIMLLSYPHYLPNVAGIANIFTITKLALTPFELLFLAGLVGWLVRWIRSKNKPEIHASN